MARSRNIKPGFFTNELLGTYDPIISLCFAGLWCLADKNGILEDRPLRIRAELFPYREGLDVNGYLTVMERDGFLTRYEVDGVRYIQINNFEKHQTPHHTEKPRGYPKPPVEQSEKRKHPLTPLSDGENQVPTRSDSLIHGFTDSLIPDSLTSPANAGSVSLEGSIFHFPKDKKPQSLKVSIREAKPETELQAACRETWASYSRAYFEKYHTEPVRNAKTNAQVKQFVQRIGFVESPGVAAYYLTHPDGYYVRKMHDFGLLLADAEKIRTEWATGRKMTGTRAKQNEQAGTMVDIVAEIQRERGLA